MEPISETKPRKGGTIKPPTRTNSGGGTHRPPVSPGRSVGSTQAALNQRGYESEAARTIPNVRLRATYCLDTEVGYWQEELASGRVKDPTLRLNLGKFFAGLAAPTLNAVTDANGVPAAPPTIYLTALPPAHNE